MLVWNSGIKTADLYQYRGERRKNWYIIDKQKSWRFSISFRPLCTNMGFLFQQLTCKLIDYISNSFILWMMWFFFFFRTWKVEWFHLLDPSGLRLLLSSPLSLEDHFHSEFLTNLFMHLFHFYIFHFKRIQLDKQMSFFCLFFYYF